jgi:sarcosine oxidase
VTDRVDVAIVGGGVMGLSTAWVLAKRGRTVVVLEQFDVGSPRCSSHGASRVYRTFYDKQHYASMALEALPLWRDLEQDVGAELLRIVGSISTLERIDSDRANLDALGVPYEILTADEAGARFPDVHLPGDVLHQPDTAVLAADATLAGLKRRLGGAVREGARVTAIDEVGSHIAVTGDGFTIEAETVVASCGAYAPALLSACGIDLAMEPTQETIAYFRHRSGTLPDGLPVINDLGRLQRYGLPTPSLRAYKLAEHGTGPLVDPRTVDIGTTAERVERLAYAASEYLPGFDPEPVGAETCVYENTPDRDFVIDRRGRIVVGAGFSGHGFKFAPLIGQVLADLADQHTPTIDLTPFSLERPSLKD